MFFFFIVNQSQRFRGFARMKAPAKRNKEEIAWKLPDKMKAHGFSFGEVIKVSYSRFAYSNYFPPIEVAVFE